MLSMPAVRGEQDRAAGRLVDAARFHADEAVLDQVEAADAIVVAELVELGQQRCRRQFLAVDRDWIALVEIDRDDRRLVRRILGRNGALVNIFGRLGGRVFEHFAFGRRVQQVGVDREWRLAALVLGDRDLVLFGEVEQRLTALEAPTRATGR